MKTSSTPEFFTQAAVALPEQTPHLAGVLDGSARTYLEHRTNHSGEAGRLGPLLLGYRRERVLTAEALPKDATLDLFDTPLKADKQRQFLSLRCAHLARAGSTSARDTNTVEGDADLVWKRLLHLPRGTNHRDAYRWLTAPPRLPWQLSPEHLRHESVSLEANLSLDTDVSGDTAFSRAVHRRLDVLRGLFSFSPLLARMEAGMRAALGLSLQGRFRVTLGGIGAQPGRVRFRLERLDRRTLSLAARLHLGMTYDWGDPLEPLLEDALNLNPVEPLRRMLFKLADLRAAGKLDGGHHPRALLGREAYGLMLRVLGVKDAPLPQDLRRLASVGGHLRQVYVTADPGLRPLLDDLILADRVGASPKTAAVLKKLATMRVGREEPAKHLFTEGFKDTLPLLAVLTGKGPAAWVLMGRDAHQPITLAADLCKQILTVLAEMPRDLGQGLLAVIRNQGAGGLRDAYDREKTVLPSTLNREQLRGAAQLVGLKADRPTPDRVPVLAQLSRLWREGSQEAKAAQEAGLGFLRGQLAFDATLSWERISRQETLLDLEFNPSAPALRNAWPHLTRLDLNGFLAELPQFATIKDGLVFHHGLFTRSHERRTAFNSVGAGLDGERRFRRLRTVQRRIEVGEQGRTVSVSGSGVVAYAPRPGVTWEGGLRFEAEASDELRAPLAPLTLGHRRLVLHSHRHQKKPSTASTAALGSMLAALHLPVDLERLLDQSEGADRIDLNLHLAVERPALSRLRGIVVGMDASMLETRYREALVHFVRHGLDQDADQPMSTVLTEAAMGETYRDAFPRTSILKSARLKQDNHDLRLTAGLGLVLLDAGPRSKRMLPILKRLIKYTPLTRRIAPNVFEQLAKAWSITLHRLSPTPWPSPLFPIWLLYSLLGGPTINDLIQKGHLKAYAEITTQKEETQTTTRLTYQTRKPKEDHLAA